MALTQEERNAVVDLRLQGLTVRQVANQTGHATNTVTKVWRGYMAEHAGMRREEVEARREELVQRAEQVAQNARSEAVKYRRVEVEEALPDGTTELKVKRKGDPAAYQRLLAVELQALRDVARLTGADLPVRVEVSGQVNVTVEDARRRLTEHLAGLCQSPN